MAVKDKFHAAKKAFHDRVMELAVKYKCIEEAIPFTPEASIDQYIFMVIGRDATHGEQLELTRLQVASNMEYFFLDPCSDNVANMTDLLNAYQKDYIHFYAQQALEQDDAVKTQ